MSSSAQSFVRGITSPRILDLLSHYPSPVQLTKEATVKRTRGRILPPWANASVGIVDGKEGKPEGVKRYRNWDKTDYNPSQSKPYPFSTSTSAPHLAAPLPAPRPNFRPTAGLTTAQHLMHSNIAEYDPTLSRLSQFRTTLGAVNDRNYIRVGSVVAVTTYTTSAKTHATTFSGLVIAVDNKGLNTSFVVRSVVLRTATEMRFSVMSPLVREIRVIKNADGRVGGLRRVKSRRLFWVRNAPALMDEAMRVIAQDHKANSGEGRRTK